MATPSDKVPEIDEMIQEVFGIDRVKSIKENKCVFCGRDATEFRDELSKKEFSISGICQSCQDSIWLP